MGRLVTGGIDAAVIKEPRRCELADRKRHSTFVLLY